MGKRSYHDNYFVLKRVFVNLSKICHLNGTRHSSNLFAPNCICELVVGGFSADHALFKLFEQCAVGYVFDRWCH